MLGRKFGVSLAIFALSFTAVSSQSYAESARKPIPTLLIKGEIMALDTSDVSSIQLKLRDRYGFETPLYLNKSTRISQGNVDLGTSQLREGQEVEVQYNFDVNTAKRHAVSVALTDELPVTVTAPTTDVVVPEPVEVKAPPVVMSAPEPVVPETGTVTEVVAEVGEVVPPAAVVQE